MASAGPTIAGTGAAISIYGGTVDWVNPGNITANDTTYATCTMAGEANPSGRGIRATNFGFAIGTGKVVTNVKLEFRGHTSVSNVSFYSYARNSGSEDLAGGSLHQYGLLTGADTTVNLQATIGSLTNYKDINDIISCRTWQQSL